jgi:hypothetical protein
MGKILEYCPICEELFGSEEKMLEHFTINHPSQNMKDLQKKPMNLKSKAMCPECGKWFLTMYAMQEHRLNHRSKILPYRCFICETETYFKSVAELKEKLNSFMICPTCNGQYKLKLDSNYEIQTIVELPKISDEVNSYKEKMNELSSLYADGKIGKETYISASRTLEDKIKATDSPSNPTTYKTSYSKNQTELDPKLILLGIVTLLIFVGGTFWVSGLNNTPRIQESDYTIVIDSDTNWSGSIGGLGGQSTQSGSGHATFTIHSSLVSTCIQKQTTNGYLTVSITKNNQVIASQTTNSEYGVVAVSGS